MSGKLILFWDFDAEWGAERSRSGGGPKPWGPLEFECTERLLRLLERFGVKACFAVVGAVALPGSRPYHDPGLIREIAAQGHEIASHAMHHEWLPGVGKENLRHIIRQSREVLETCISQPVTTFAPTYNQPFDFLERGSISLSERREVPRDRVDLGFLCRVLHEEGFTFCRVAYKPLGERLLAYLGYRHSFFPKVEIIRGVATLRVNAFGFRSDTLNHVNLATEEGGYVVCFAHPHALSGKGAQSEEQLMPFLEETQKLVKVGKLEIVLPREIVSKS
ncbi:MAG: polysaccharide deacetylase family protein [Thermanaerothrix sp.]|nr:polysaccharide deacetylase family protein [Thermanaerothrix sp.]